MFFRRNQGAPQGGMGGSYPVAGVSLGRNANQDGEDDDGHHPGEGRRQMQSPDESTNLLLREKKVGHHQPENNDPLENKRPNSISESDEKRRSLPGSGNRFFGSGSISGSRSREGWRLSKSSVSSIYHSAQELDLMSDCYFSDEGEPTSPFRSYHSIQESLCFDTDRDDIFSSPAGSMTFPKKVLKSVAFREEEIMTLPEIDFVLVWDDSEQALSDGAREKRRVFEKNLEEDGLKLERERLDACSLNFIKIHAPIEILRRYAEILKLRMPMKQPHGDVVEKLYGEIEEFGFKIPQMLELRNHPENSIKAEVLSWFHIFTDYFRVDPRIFPPEDQKYTAIYSRDKEYLFDVDEKEFFTPATRARILDFILRRKRYTEDNFDDFAFGIERLLTSGVYSAAYPLHDGDLKTPGSQRHLLSMEWASVSKCLKYQPVDAIKEYFGVKIGLYFAWLGFYTHMLIFAAGLGILCFLYGCFTLYQNQYSEDVCNSAKNITMCPLCDTVCDYWKLHDVCFYARLTYLFDNDATVLFAVLMSFWSAIFLECWKRYSAEITHRWDLTGFDIQEEHPREEYLVRLKHVKKHERNTVTSTNEPYVPFWKMKLPYRMFSISMVLLLICLACAAVVAVVTYRLAITLAINSRKDQIDVHSWGLILVSTTAACINLVFIYFFNWLYTFLAEYLTEIELHRTQTEFDDSITLKMYMLQFVNYYSSIFYIAFFKGKFVGSPAKYTKIFRKYRQEECGPGCMTELCIQLAIIMVGKQALNTILEMIWPIAIKWFTQFKLLTGITHEKRTLFTNQWAKDYRLLDWGARSLFPEYLEMVLQYGFVTIFVAAFPLAPLFALLNNILEMRLDAKKLLVYYRRPVGQRVKDIGVWYNILDSVGKLAVISNAFIIAFTSNFIPKMVYRYGLHPSNDTRYGTLNGFLEHSLASFNTSSLELPPAEEYLKQNESICRYPTYRHSYNYPDQELRYKRTDFYWKVMMARLAFVVVFENIVAVCVMLLKYVIPDIPRKLMEQIRRESYLTNEIIIKQEMKRARGVTAGGDSTAWNPVSDEKDIELVRCPSNPGSLRRRNVDDFSVGSGGSGGSGKKVAEVMV